MMSDHGFEPTSPLGMQRDPTIQEAGPSGPPPPDGSGFRGTADGAGSSGFSKEGGGQVVPPAGADLSFNAPNMDEVSAGRPPNSTSDDLKGFWGAGKEAPPPKPPPGPPDAGTPVLQKWEDTPAGKKKGMSDPDADTTGGGDGTVLVGGGYTDSVEGQGRGPQVEGPPPEKPDLVIDRNPDADVLEDGVGAGLPGGAPAAPVIHTINPDSGITPTPTGGGPPPSGDPGGGDRGLVGTSSAATAAVNDDVADQGIASVGSGGGGGIQTTVPENADPAARGAEPAVVAADVLGVAPAVAAPAVASPAAVSSAPVLVDEPPAASLVEEVAAPAFAPAPVPAAELVTAGLAGDLAGDLSPKLDDGPEPDGLLLPRGDEAEGFLDDAPDVVDGA